MKADELRGGICNEETQLCDLLSKKSLPCKHLFESIIELRDLQGFLEDMRSHVHIDKALDIIAEGMVYYVNRMHLTDANTFANVSSRFLREGMNSSEIYDGIYKLLDCIDAMCAVNRAVMRSFLKGAISTA